MVSDNFYTVNVFSGFLIEAKGNEQVAVVQIAFCTEAISISCIKASKHINTSTFWK